MAVTVLSIQDLVSKLALQKSNPNYYCMYSSLYEGLVEGSSWMMLPLDDHMVHRGDGVFEALKVVNGRIYLFDEHMARMESSAKALSLPLYKSLEMMKKIIQETWEFAQKKTGQSEAILRVFLSRGPGNFSTNPYDTIGSQFYVAATRLTALPTDKYENGVKVGRSQIPVKPSWLAQVKSCNYLPNVMLKKEAIDAGLDFTVGFDPQGFLAEGSTENIALLTEDGYLVKPKLEFILRGCTMTRVFELAEKLQTAGQIRGIESRDIAATEIPTAKEVFMLGTTLDVLPVTGFEGKPIANGKPGPIGKALQALLLADQKS